MTTKYTLTGYPTTLMGMCLGSDGNIWTCAYNDIINKVTPAGVVSYYSGPSRSEDVCCLGNGLWITNALVGGISALNISTPGSVTHYTPTSLDTCGVCVGPDGNIWYTAGSSSAVTYIQAVSTSGTLVAGASLAGFVTNMLRLCAGPDGNLWVTDSGGHILQVNTSAVALNEYAVGTTPRDICTGPDGNLWVADYNALVWKVTTAGVATSYALSGAEPVAICKGPDGNLWVADALHAVWCVTPSGSATKTTLTGATPKAVCAGADGNIWVLDNAGYVWVIVLSTPKVYVGPLVVG